MVDLPLLFHPFANQSFHFDSELVAPKDFDGTRYMFSCAVAAHRFVQKIEQQRSRGKHRRITNLREYGSDDAMASSIVVAGSNHLRPSSELWWALTQPRGNLAIRLGGYILSKVFCHTASVIELDVASAVALAKQIKSSSVSEPPAHVVIAPTLRSFYDFLIVSYICFSLPELGLDVPHIAAASEFVCIPIVGWLAGKCRAFFLK